MAQFVISTLFDTNRHNSLAEWLSKFEYGQKKIALILNLHNLYAIMLAKTKHL